jgi:hypothetical protein
MMIQAKLTIGQPNDKYEQEADRVADEVMRMPEPQVQRQMEEEETLQAQFLGEQITPLVQRQVEPEEELLQAEGHPGHTPEVTPDLESRIQALKGGGQPLRKSERAFFEPRFGQEFGHVRIHSNSEVAKMARQMNAKAFTAGRDILFGAGQYAPHTYHGKRLLSHELTHMVQQGGANDDRLEMIVLRREAEKGKGPPVSTASMVSPFTRNELGKFFKTREPVWFEGPHGGHWTLLVHQKTGGSISLEQLVSLLNETEGFFRGIKYHILTNHNIMAMECYFYGLMPELPEENGFYTFISTEGYFHTIDTYVESYEHKRYLEPEATAEPSVEEKLSEAKWELNKAVDRLHDVADRLKPELAEAIRTAFLSGDEDKMEKLTNVTQTALDISLSLNELSREIAVALAEKLEAEIPPALRYTRLLEDANKRLAIFNLVYSILKVEAPTEWQTMSNKLVSVTKLFPTATTLLNAAPGISLYANYVALMSEWIINTLSSMHVEHLYKISKVAAKVGWSIDWSIYPGSEPMGRFMKEVMGAKGASGVPWPISPQVQNFLLDKRELIECGVGSNMPTVDFFWRELDPYSIRGWIYRHRRKLWAMFYGSMEVPSR